MGKWSAEKNAEQDRLLGAVTGALWNAQHEDTVENWEAVLAAEQALVAFFPPDAEAQSGFLREVSVRGVGFAQAEIERLKAAARG